MDIDQTDKFYPLADEWMWNYCTFLGKWTDPETGDNWDLGIFIPKGDSPFRDTPCCASVYSNVLGSYNSAEVYREPHRKPHPMVEEVYKRARKLNLIPPTEKEWIDKLKEINPDA
jgi:hypothetical protein